MSTATPHTTTTTQQQQSNSKSAEQLQNEYENESLEKLIATMIEHLNSESVYSMESFKAISKTLKEFKENNPNFKMDLVKIIEAYSKVGKAKEGTSRIKKEASSMSTATPHTTTTKQQQQSNSNSKSAEQLQNEYENEALEKLKATMIEGLKNESIRSKAFSKIVKEFKEHNPNFKMDSVQLSNLIIDAYYKAKKGTSSTDKDSIKSALEFAFPIQKLPDQSVDWKNLMLFPFPPLQELNVELLPPPQSSITRWAASARLFLHNRNFAYDSFARGACMALGAVMQAISTEDMQDLGNMLMPDCHGDIAKVIEARQEKKLPVLKMKLGMAALAPWSVSVRYIDDELMVVSITVRFKYNYKLSEMERGSDQTKSSTLPKKSDIVTSMWTFESLFSAGWQFTGGQEVPEMCWKVARIE